MKKSKDSKVQQFIDGIELTDPTKYQILQQLRSIVFKQFPKIQEKMMFGGIIFSLAKDVSGIFAYKNHVSMEFSDGYQLKDPKKQLEGKGKFRRHLKFQSLEDIAAKEVEFYVKQISAE